PQELLHRGVDLRNRRSHPIREPRQRLDSALGAQVFVDAPPRLLVRARRRRLQPGVVERGRGDALDERELLAERGDRAVERDVLGDGDVARGRGVEEALERDEGRDVLVAQPEDRPPRRELREDLARRRGERERALPEEERAIGEVALDRALEAPSGRGGGL